MQIHETWVATAVNCLGFLDMLQMCIHLHTYFEYIWIQIVSNCYFLLFSPFWLQVFRQPGSAATSEAAAVWKGCAAVSVFSRIARCSTCCWARNDDCQHHENKLQRFWQSHPPNEALWQSRSHEVTTKAYKTNQSARTLMYFFFSYSWNSSVWQVKTFSSHQTKPSTSDIDGPFQWNHACIVSRPHVLVVVLEGSESSRSWCPFCKKWYPRHVSIWGANHSRLEDISLP